MPDDTTEIAKATAEGLAEGTTRATLEAFGAPGIELTRWGGDIIRARRAKTQIKLAAKVQAILDETGLSPHVVPAKTLFPLLEYATLEEPEDDDMITRWAALLVNAGTSESEIVPPAFPRILDQLSPTEAQLLDWLAPLGAGASLTNFMARAGFNPATGEDEPRYQALIDNLERLKVCTVERPIPELQRLQSQINDIKNKSPEFRGHSTVGMAVLDTSIRISELGRAFVAACTPPKA